MELGTITPPLGAHELGRISSHITSACDPSCPSVRPRRTVHDQHHLDDGQMSTLATVATSQEPLPPDGGQ